jgi:hypothetical protein
MKVHYNFTIFRIWDTGEAGILTVLPPPLKVVTTKGLKQVQKNYLLPTQR